MSNEQPKAYRIHLADPNFQPKHLAAQARLVGGDVRIEPEQGFFSLFDNGPEEDGLKQAILRGEKTFQLQGEVQPGRSHTSSDTPEPTVHGAHRFVIEPIEENKETAQQEN